jgi:hypothetical protein
MTTTLGVGLTKVSLASTKNVVSADSSAATAAIGPITRIGVIAFRVRLPAVATTVASATILYVIQT